MLDPWIIEEIKRREQRRRIDQPVVQIPVQGPDRDREPKRKKDEDQEENPRGVDIIDFGIGAGAPPSYSW